jgi:hypothetical protein
MIAASGEFCPAVATRTPVIGADVMAARCGRRLIHVRQQHPDAVRPGVTLLSPRVIALLVPEKFLKLRRRRAAKPRVRSLDWLRR